MAFKRQMKILILPRYGMAGPSSRYRFYQYFGILKENGIDFRVCPLYSDNYVNLLFTAGRKNHFEALKGYLKRLCVILTSIRYDLIVTEHEFLPYFPAWFEKLFKIFRIDYIVDYDDAIFIRYEQSRNKLVRLLLGKKIKKVIRYAKAVITGNKYLFEYASRFNDNVYMIPTVVSFKKYDAVIVPEKPKQFIVGWTGSQTTSQYLIPLSSLFRKLKKAGIQINLIGFDKKLKFHFKDININWIDWTTDSEIEEIKKFNVGIMPLDDDLWSKGKCGFKLIQYMACNLPVIASPIGANVDLVDNGTNGFLATSIDEWTRSVLYLAENPEEAISMGQKGYNRFRENYSLEAVADRYISIIKSSMK
jgi:glycosyltransferase involved in cell wall biosynthesis